MNKTLRFKTNRVIIITEVSIVNKPDNNYVRKKFGENLRALRVSRGYSQMKFAKLVDEDLTQAAISAWELGIREPEFSVIFQIANTFKVPVSSLIPLEASGIEEDIVRMAHDILRQNPCLIPVFDKLRHFDEKQMNVVISVIDAISKEPE